LIKTIVKGAARIKQSKAIFFMVVRFKMIENPILFDHVIVKKSCQLLTDTWGKKNAASRAA
jgi:hypothetical protein